MRTHSILPRVALPSLAAIFSILTAGCQYRPFCLNCDRGDGITFEAHDLSTDDADPYTNGIIDMTPVCDPTRVQTDPANCGECGFVCSAINAIPSCVHGQCGILRCDVGWVDLDKDPRNGCEYPCLTTGSEICDGIDNDCDGVVDNGFDLNADALNCGVCGTICGFASAEAVCVQGACHIGTCDPGYANNDSNESNGCEYHCPVAPPLAYERCNGIDDNCDGRVDEPSALETPPVDLCVTTPGTPCVNRTISCDTRTAGTTWYCDYPAGVEYDPSIPNGIVLNETKCDGIDNDCSGLADDTFPALGNTCDNGLLGACRDVGAIICDPSNTANTICDLSVLPDAVPGAPHAETCNNVDDDCDGTVDNSSGARRIIQDMVHITSGGMNFYIDRYEASRPDASSLTAGVVVTRSCSNADAVPWASVSHANALAACTAAGLRLCTGAEWQQACGGASVNSYPYGSTYQGGDCNGVDEAPDGGVHELLPTGAPSLSACVTPTGLHDLSGNLKEWTSDSQGMTSDMPPQTIYVTRGGSFDSPSGGLTCTTTFAQAAEQSVLGTLGFRCCKTTAP